MPEEHGAEIPLPGGGVTRPRPAVARGDDPLCAAARVRDVEVVSEASESVCLSVALANEVGPGQAGRANPACSRKGVERREEALI